MVELVTELGSVHLCPLKHDSVWLKVLLPYINT